MNTVKSVYYGWATLIAAGGGAYFFAKRSINADRAAKADADRQKRMRIYELEQAALQPPSSQSQTSQSHAQNARGRSGGGAQDSGNPSTQAHQDPAPTRHEPVGEEAGAREKSKYEASDVYRSRKGDRFS